MTLCASVYVLTCMYLTCLAGRVQAGALGTGVVWCSPASRQHSVPQKQSCVPALESSESPVPELAAAEHFGCQCCCSELGSAPGGALPASVFREGNAEIGGEQ